MTVEASCFSPGLFTFLRELGANNDREWFAANKSRYVAEVQEPALAFVEDVGLRLPDVSRHFVADARTQGGSLFRIYRDVRFSKDKSPYKTQVGIQFRHAQARDAHAPGFYLHLEPDSVFMACGTWHPDRDTLHAIRTAIASRPSSLADGRRRPGVRAALPARRRGTQAPAGRLRPRSPADRRTQAQGLHRHRRPDRVRRHRRRVPRPVPRPLRRGRRLHALPVRERTRAVLIRLHCK